MNIYQVLLDGKFFKEIKEESQKLAKIEAKKQSEFFLKNGYSKVTVKKIGIVLHHVSKEFRYSDVPGVDERVLKTIKAPMLTAIAKEEFSCDNMTYFMLERGLVNEDRESLSSLGLKIKQAIFK